MSVSVKPAENPWKSARVELLRAKQEVEKKNKMQMQMQTKTLPKTPSYGFKDTNVGAAGVMIFIHNSQFYRVQTFLNILNSSGRVTPEVHSLYAVKPTRDAVKQLCAKLRVHPELSHLENIHKLKPNNSLRDLTAYWRITNDFANEFTLVVSLETVSEVSDALRTKYPIPNLTLPAGKRESGETVLETATRELFEETRICVGAVDKHVVGLMGKGMMMFSVYIMPDTKLELINNNLYIESGILTPEPEA